MARMSSIEIESAMIAERREIKRPDFAGLNRERKGGFDAASFTELLAR